MDRDIGAPATFHLKSLGDVELTGPSGDLLQGRRKILALLAYLVRRGNGPLPRAELATLLWGERPQSRAMSSLREALHQLRGALGEALETDRKAVSLRPGAVGLDLTELEVALEGRRFRDALDLWGGEFLPELEDAGTGEFRNWLEGERQALRKKVFRAMQALVQGAEERGDWNEAVRWAEQWAELSALDEGAQATLIRTLRLAGRTREAAERADAVRKRFREELGTDPDLPEIPGSEDQAPQPLSPDPCIGSAALFTPDLVGRARHFTELVAAWRRVVAGDARAILLRGEHGTGKTRLADEFLGWVADRDDAMVLRAQAYRAESGVPFSAAAALFRGIIRAPGLSAAPDQAVAELSALVPALRERYPGLPPSTGGMEALTGALLRVVEEVAVEVPLVLFLDDLDVADAQSRCLLLALGRRLPPSALLLLSARSGEGSPPDAAEECRASGVQLLPLECLEPAECEEMLASMLPMEPGSRKALARLLYEESGGNPFYFEEMLATLVDEGHLRADQRGLWKTDREIGKGPLPLPASVSDAVHRRLARLGPRARETVKAAAVLWPLVTSDLLRDVAGLDEETLSAGLDELLSRRLLRSGLEIPGSYRFSHELLRRVAYEEVPPHHREALHRSLAGLLADRAEESRSVEGAYRYHRERAGGPIIPLASRRRPWESPAAGVAMTGVVAALAFLAAWMLPGSPGGERALPLMAMGEIREHVQAPGPPTASALQDMLSTNLARVDGLRILSTPRIYEMAAREGVGMESGPGITRAARAAGADEILEGALYRTPQGLWRLDLQGVHLATGVVRYLVTVEDAEIFGLVDRASAGVAAELGLTPPPLRLAQVTTHSLEAYRFYEEGLRTFYRGDREHAAALFRAALREDSTFVMAEFWAGRSLLQEEVPEGLAHFQRAMHLADRVGERERLIIRGTWMDLMDEPAREAYADSLLARYPDEPKGYYLRGRALLRRGDFLGAAAVLRAAVAMDSASSAAPGVPCSACEAASQAVAAYWMADSLAAAEAMARDWIRFQPQAAPPWDWLSHMLEHQGRFQEALEARRTAAGLLTFPRAGDRLYPALVELKRENFTEADRLLLEHIRSGTGKEVRQARWLYAISLRWQGRLEEALEVALDYRGRDPESGADTQTSGAEAQPSGNGAGARTPSPNPSPHALLHAQVLYEAGRLNHAAALFDSLGFTFSSRASEGLSARQRSWMLTHSADASADAGDTTRVALLADSIRRLGARSGFGRDHLLHHHVRGRLLLARGDTAGARRELEAAIFSPNAGFTRTNYELARLELATGHPEQAISLLQPVFRAPVDVSNFYLARTEVRHLLGEAWLQAQRPDSALAHLRRAARAWRNADPTFEAKERAVQEAIREAGG